VVPSSLNEEIQMSLSEALFLAKAAVATRVGGIQVIENGVNGLLISARDEKWPAKAYIYLINDYGWPMQLDVKGRETAESGFSTKGNAEKVVQLYASIVSLIDHV
jgi:glycosyltransferase involved in cell wall biosynthesis